MKGQGRLAGSCRGCKFEQRCRSPGIAGLSLVRGATAEVLPYEVQRLQAELETVKKQDACMAESFGSILRAGPDCPYASLLG